MSSNIDVSCIKYLTDHPTQCTCVFCKRPSFRYLLIDISTVHSRLYFVQRKFSESCFAFQQMYTHWMQNQERYAPQLVGSHSHKWALATYRMLWFYGQCLRRTITQCDASLEIFRKAEKYVSSLHDEAIEHELKMQIENAIMLRDNAFKVRQSSQHINVFQPITISTPSKILFVDKENCQPTATEKDNQKDCLPCSSKNVKSKDCTNILTTAKQATVSSTSSNATTKTLPTESKPISKATAISITSITKDHQITTKPATKTSSRTMPKPTQAVDTANIAIPGPTETKSTKRNVSSLRRATSTHPETTKTHRHKTAPPPSTLPTISKSSTSQKDSEIQTLKTTAIPKATQHPVKQSPNGSRPISNDTNIRVSSRALVAAAGKTIRPARTVEPSREPIARVTRGAARRDV